MHAHVTIGPWRRARPARLSGGRRARGLTAWLVAAALAVAVGVPLIAQEALVPPPALVREQAAALEPGARARMEGWADLLEHPPTALKGRLQAVNDYFNAQAFVADDWLWDTADYWATPSEFLTQGAGDCEDFALAKYFTLVAVGVPEARLQLTYVKALELGQAHMVLTYYPAPGAVPLVLDNLNPRIVPATERRDLLPVYSFNGTGLWIASQRGAGERVGSSLRLSRWRELLARLAGSAPIAPPPLSPANAEEIRP